MNKGKKEEIIRIKVIPNSKKEIIENDKPNHWIFKIKEKAENNMANDRVLEIVKTMTHKKAKNVKILSGHQKPTKILVAEY